MYTCSYIRDFTVTVIPEKNYKGRYQRGRLLCATVEDPLLGLILLLLLASLSVPLTHFQAVGVERGGLVSLKEWNRIPKFPTRTENTLKPNQKCPEPFDARSQKVRYWRIPYPFVR